MDPMVQGQMKEWFVMLATFGLFFSVAFLLAGLFRRRQKDAMQKVLLDKFSSAQDFAEFMQSPAGQKYVMSFADAVTSPKDAILRSIQIGIVALFLGAGFFIASDGSPYLHFVLFAIANILACVGVGFLVSGTVSYFLARKIHQGVKE
jgi:hypothetical protein